MMGRAATIHTTLATSTLVPAAGVIEEIAINSLVLTGSTRMGGENPDHVAMLADTDAPLPPILVHAPSMRVIDGMHRLRAARTRGRSTITAELFRGSEEAAFIRAVRANVSHGLLLTPSDRRAAAARIIQSDPGRSDRWIAESTRISARSVASIRRRLAGDGASGRIRTGRDGRFRPAGGGSGREFAAELLAGNQNMTVRKLAEAAGISVGTAHDVRERVRRGEHPVPAGLRARIGARDGSIKRGTPSTGPVEALESALRRLRSDPSVRYSEVGRNLLRWIESRSVTLETGMALLDAAPSHCAPLLATIARQVAQTWLELASEIERREVCPAPGISWPCSTAALPRLNTATVVPASNHTQGGRR